MQNLKKEIEKSEPIFAGVEKVSEPLFEECNNLNVENGIDEVGKEMDDFKERHEALKVFLLEREEKVNEAEDSLANVTNELKPVGELMSEIEMFISHPIRFGDDVKKGQEALEKIEVFIDVLAMSRFPFPSQ